MRLTAFPLILVLAGCASTADTADLAAEAELARRCGAIALEALPVPLTPGAEAAYAGMADVCSKPDLLDPQASLRAFEIYLEAYRSEVPS